MTDDHGNCPKCKVDLNGGGIWQTGYDLAMRGQHYKQEGVPAKSVAEAEELADKYASNYGATRTEGRWGRQIGMSDMVKDRIVFWVCPDCKHEWPR